MARLHLAPSGLDARGHAGLSRIGAPSPVGAEIQILLTGPQRMPRRAASPGRRTQPSSGRPIPRPHRPNAMSGSPGVDRRRAAGWRPHRARTAWQRASAPLPARRSAAVSFERRPWGRQRAAMREARADVDGENGVPRSRRRQATHRHCGLVSFLLLRV